MRFAEPVLLWWLILLLPLLILLSASAFRRKQRALTRLGDPTLIGKIADLVSLGRWSLQTTFLVGAAVFFLLALARPQWGVSLQTLERGGVDVIIALDTSTSMLVEDLHPDRLTRMRHEVAQGLDRLGGNRVGLLSFAGSGYLQCPLTLDHRAVRMFLDIIDTGIIPRQGTNIEKAIQLALDAFPDEGKKQKVILILTDGENQEGDPLRSARAARDAGAIIHVVGLGSPRGGPIPLRDNTGRLLDYKRDANGQVVMSRLTEPLLQEIATTGGGLYIRAESGRFVLSRIVREINRMEQKTFQSTRQQRYEARFQYALVPALFFLLCETFLSRRGKRRVRVGRF